MIAIDTETYVITPGILAPRVVCLSFATATESGLVVGDEAIARKAYEVLISDEVIAGANLAYDFGVLARHEPGLLDLIFAKIEKGQVFDVLIAEALNAIAHGNLFRDPRRLMPGGKPSPLQAIDADGSFGKLMNRYSLQTCVWLALGRKDAKANDKHRLRYAELDGVPLEYWPEEARTYPIDDAVNTLNVAMHQSRMYENLGNIPGMHSHMTHQVRAAWAMHLAAVYGLKVDAERVHRLEQSTQIEYDRAYNRLVELGFIREDGKVDGLRIKTEIAKAYGALESDPCPNCNAGKCISPKSGKPIICKLCSGTGLNIPETCPRTPAGGIAKDRDTLDESDIPKLAEVSELTKINKIKETYLPMLKAGLKAPINVKGNVLLETGRASFEGLVQLIPRKGGVRECFVARDGFYFCSVDYSALELCTLAQILYDWFPGESRMAEAIIKSGDPGALHTEFAAKMCNVPVAEFKKLIAAKDKDAENKRQMAKAANFGFPGLMGAAKLTIAKRKEGLRFCTTAGVSQECGEEMVVEWNSRELTSPTCKHCLQVAEDLRRQWLQQWPEMQRYWAKLKTYPGGNTFGAVVSEPSSHRTGFARGGMSLTNLANHNFQSLAAFGAKHALWNVTKEAYTVETSSLFGSRVVLFIHDEICVEVPIERAHEAGYRQSEIMIDSMREFTPDIPIVAEPTLMKYWYKDAKLVKDANGRMIPWEPK